MNRLIFLAVLLVPTLALAADAADAGTALPWWAQALVGMASFLGMGLTWAGKLLVDWLRESKKHLILQKTSQLMLRIVMDLYNTEVEALKAAAADGKLTQAEKDRFKSLAVQSLKSWLGPKGVKAVLWAVGAGTDSLDVILGAEAEAAITAAKNAARLPS